MQERRNISSGGPWESMVGYSRAVRVGPWVLVSGTTSMTTQGLVGRSSAYEQARQAFRTIENALHEAGASILHVVRTRMFVTNIQLWEQVARAHDEVLGTIRPAATMVEIKRLIDPEMLVEIEVDAYVPETPDRPPGFGSEKK